jgi:hypothetical protein
MDACQSIDRGLNQTEKLSSGAAAVRGRHSARACAGNRWTGDAAVQAACGRSPTAAHEPAHGGNRTSKHAYLRPPGDGSRPDAAERYALSMCVLCYIGNLPYLLLI